MDCPYAYLMGSPSAPQIVVDADVAKRADEAYHAEIEREVQSHLEKTRMDAAQLKADLEAANKKAGDALARNTELEKKLGDAESATAQLRKDFDALKASFVAAGDAAKAALDAETLKRARLVAGARGLRGDALEVEAKRIAGFGAAAVDDLLRHTPAPSVDPLAMQVAGVAGDAAPQRINSGTTIDGRRAFTVSDRKLTVPDAKVI